LTGFLSAVFQPRRFQFGSHSVMPFAQVLAVGVDPHLGRPLQRLEGDDRRHHLHAVVGSERLAAGEFLLDRP